jgi:hypothetical protein
MSVATTSRLSSRRVFAFSRALATASETVLGVLGSLARGHVGCIVIKPDGSRYLARVVRDPPARPKPHSVLIGTRVARGAVSHYVVSDKLIWGATARILRRERALGDLSRDRAGWCDEFLLRRASTEEER